MAHVIIFPSSHLWILTIPWLSLAEWKWGKRVRRERYLIFNIDDGNQILSSSGHRCHYPIITSTSTSTQNIDIYRLIHLWSIWAAWSPDWLNLTIKQTIMLRIPSLGLTKTMKIIFPFFTNRSAFLSGLLRVPFSDSKNGDLHIMHSKQQMHRGQTMIWMFHPQSTQSKSSKKPESGKYIFMF